MSSNNTPKESTSAIEVYLHPLVIINISDHYTRVNVNRSDDEMRDDEVPRCMGILYGTQVGKRVELRTSFELVYKKTDKGVEIDKEYVDRKLKDYSQVYKGYELLGWYGTGDQLSPSDTNIHKQILGLNLNDSPLFLLCGTNFTNIDDLPISIYEASMAMEEADSSNNIEWASVPYFIETELSEQISVDNIIRATTSTKQSELILHYAKLKKAIEILKSKVDLLHQYVVAVRKGEVERDESMLRTIKGLTHRFPSIESTTFAEEYTNELNEVLMITQLAAITKGTKNLNQLIDRWNQTREKRPRFS